MSRRGAAMATVVAVLVLPALALGLEHRRAHASFRLVAARSTLVIERGASGSLSLVVERERGFRRALTLDSWRLPRGAHAVWTLPDGRPLARKRRDRRAVVVPPRADQVLLQVRTRQNVRLGTFRVRVSVMAPSARSRHWLTLSVRAHTADTELAVPLRAQLEAQLRPGVAVPVDLTIENKRDRPLTLSALSVTVDDTTSAPGCSGLANYATRQFAGGYPLVVPPGSRSLRDLTADPANLPRVELVDLPVNQDACKGARITLRLEAEGEW